MFSKRDARMKNTDWVYGAHSRNYNAAIVDFLRARESFSPYGHGWLGSRSKTLTNRAPGIGTRHGPSPQTLRRDSGFDEPRERRNQDNNTRSPKCRVKEIEDSLAGNGVVSKVFAQSVKSYREIEYLLPNYDKIFAATWLSDKEIILGTKCNNVLVLNTGTGTRVEIPSPRTQTTSPGTRSRALVNSFANLSLDTSNSDSQDDEESVDEPSDTPTTSVSIPSLSTYNHCSGIHSIEVNPSRTMVAVGAGEPTEFIQVYDLPTFRPLAVLRGHTDMVFSVEWVNDTTLVSGSRDTTVKIFSIDRESVLARSHEHETAANPPCRVPSVPSSISPGRPSYLQQLNPLPQPAIPHRVSVKHHSSKVRDLRMDRLRSQFLTLSTDGTIALWDARECRVVQSSPLIYSSETVCVGLDVETNFYAIGSQSHVSFYDPRVGGSAGEGIVHVCDSLDEGWGVRCVRFRDGVAVVGGGLGRLSFYDMRMRAYLEWTPFTTESKTVQTKTVTGEALDVRDETLSNSGIVEPAPRQRVPRPTNYLNTGKGWLLRDPLYQSHFNGTDIRNAIYAIAFEEDLVRAGTRRGGAGARLAVAGCRQVGLIEFIETNQSGMNLFISRHFPVIIVKDIKDIKEKMF
ncbi:WD40-repeat-containing domain protein [Cladochytrium replicatum]|nr:WD40-repeat-containing domain protein [Cladochytrium replicatum]